MVRISVIYPFSCLFTMNPTPAMLTESIIPDQLQVIILIFYPNDSYNFSKKVRSTVEIIIISVLKNFSRT